MGIVKQYQMAIAELGGCAHAKFWGKHNRAPDTDDAGDVAELMRTAERIMRTAGWGWAEGVQRDAESEVVGRMRTSGQCRRCGRRMTEMAERLASEWDQEHWFDFSREPAMFHKDGTMTAWCFHCGRWEDWRLCRRQD